MREKSWEKPEWECDHIFSGGPRIVQFCKFTVMALNIDIIDYILLISSLLKDKTIILKAGSKIFYFLIKVLFVISTNSRC